MPALAQTHPGQDQLVSEVARDTGKSSASLNALLDGAKKQQSILDAISRPAEGKPWKDYRPIFLTPQRINDGIAFYREHRALLESIGKQYGVAPEYIVAIVGVETSYGRITGKYKVLDALVTLGLYYPPRATYFRQQLKVLLELPRQSPGRSGRHAHWFVCRRAGLGAVHARQHPRLRRRMPMAMAAST